MSDARHPWLSIAELAQLATWRDEIERDDLGYTRTGSVVLNALDALLFAPDRIHSPISADRKRVACGLPPLDPERHEVATALDALPGYWPGASAWEPWTGFDAGLTRIGVDLPKNDPRHEDADWADAVLSQALAWLAGRVPFRTARTDKCQRGPYALVRFYRASAKQAAA